MGRQTDLPSRPTTFELFVQYAEADRAWVHGYLLPTLGLPRRQVVTRDDFRLGAPVVEEIERCVAGSRYVLIIFSRAFLEDEWTVFSEQISSHLSVRDAADHVVPVLLDDVPVPLRIDFRVHLDCVQPSRWEGEVARLRRLLGTAEPPPEELACPYPGMLHFTTDESRFFYGREEEIDRLAHRLAAERFLLVVGPSGSGKSSLVFAGILPELDHLQRRRLLVRSARPGREPMVALADQLGGPPGEYGRLVREVIERHPPATHLLIVVDQLEEVFAQAAPAERSAFLAALTVLRELDEVYLLLAMRADFYPELMVSPLWPLTPGERAEITPLRGELLSRAITRPAETVGVYLEPGLLDRLLADAADEPGVLPLLQETMRQLWSQRRRRLLTREAYEQLGGPGGNGLAGALAGRADQVLSVLSPDQRMIARRILLRLVQLGEGRGDTRRQQSVAAVMAVADDPSVFQETLRTLTNERLLILGGEAAEKQQTVDLAHEALIARWPTLRRWLDEDRAGLRVQHQLAEDAEEWEELGRDRGALYRGVRLVAASEWVDRHDADLNALEREFVEASQSQAVAEAEAKRRTDRRLRRLTFSLAILLILSLTAAGVAAIRTREAQSSLRTATSRRLAAQAVNGLDDQLRRAMLLSLAAVHSQNTVEARGALLQALQDSGNVKMMLASGPVARNALAYSPEGRHLAVGNSHGEVVIWEAATGRRLRSLSAHREWVSSVAFSPNGKTLATAGKDQRILLWDVESGARLSPPMVRHSGWITSLAFSPDGEALASADVAGAILLWDLDTLRPVDLGRHGQEPVNVVAFRDGHVLASGGDDGLIKLWDVRRKHPLAKPITHGGSINGVAFSPRGDMVASGSSDGTVRLWSFPTLRPLGKALGGHRDAVLSIAFARDGVTLASGGADKTVMVWNARTRKRLLGPLLAHGDEVSAVAFAPDGSLASGGVDDTVVVWDLDRTPSLATTRLNHDGEVYAVAFHPDGTTLSSAGADGAVILWDVTTGRRRHPPLRGHRGHVTSLAFSPDGRVLASGSADGTVRLWDPEQGRPIGSPLRGHGGQAVNAVQFSPDGRLLASGGRDHRITLWDLIAGKQASAPLRHDESVITFAFAPAGSTLAAGTAGGEILLWNLQRGSQPVWRQLGHSGPVGGVSFSPDGTEVISAGTDNVILLWDRSTGARRGTELTAHGGEIYSLAVSSRGRLFASGSSDDTVRLWDGSTGSPLGPPLTGHTGDVWAVALNRAGTLLASASSDRTVRVWEVSLAAWKQRACNLVKGNLSTTEWKAQVQVGQYAVLCPSYP
jgi:WD40 repeat protein